MPQVSNATNTSPKNKNIVTPELNYLKSDYSAVSNHEEGETQWWFDGRTKSNKALEEAVERSNCTHVLFNIDQYKTINTSKRSVIWVNNLSEIESLEKYHWILTPNEDVYAKAKLAGRTVGLYIEVKDLEAQFEYCISVCERKDPFVVIDIEHATYIPYELLIAKAQGTQTKVLRSVPIGDLEGIVDPIDQSLNAFSTMEQGISVLFKTESTEAIEDFTARIKNRQRSKINLVPATVIEVRHTGLGHRVCVDSTSMMSPEEGMLIGSTGWGGIFVCSETHYLPHMNLREFRVNAGSVHSYIWGPNNNAMYLSEMRAGSEVLGVDTNGNSRVITVGRAKIERRPLLNIRCKISLDHIPGDIRKAVEQMQFVQNRVTPKGEKLAVEDMNYVYINAFLQNDWHVRIMGTDGKIKHCATLRKGDEILANVDNPGRHTGLKVTEHIIEK